MARRAAGAVRAAGAAPLGPSGARRRPVDAVLARRDDRGRSAGRHGEPLHELVRRAVRRVPRRPAARRDRRAAAAGQAAVSGRRPGAHRGARRAVRGRTRAQLGRAPARLGLVHPASGHRRAGQRCVARAAPVRGHADHRAAEPLGAGLPPCAVVDAPVRPSRAAAARGTRHASRARRVLGGGRGAAGAPGAGAARPDPRRPAGRGRTAGHPARRTQPPRPRAARLGRPPSAR